MVVPILAVDPSTLDLVILAAITLAVLAYSLGRCGGANRRFAEVSSKPPRWALFFFALRFSVATHRHSGGGALCPLGGRQHRPSDRSLMAGGRVKSRARATRTASIILQLLGQRAPRQRSRPEGPGRKAARLRPGAQESVTRPAGGGRPNPPSAHLHSASWLAHYTDSVRFVRHLGQAQPCGRTRSRARLSRRAASKGKTRENFGQAKSTSKPSMGAAGISERRPPVMPANVQALLQPSGVPS